MYIVFIANHIYTGLVSDPLSKSLVLNNKDGNLQFYKPETDSLAFTVSGVFIYLGEKVEFYFIYLWKHLLSLTSLLIRFMYVTLLKVLVP